MANVNQRRWGVAVAVAAVLGAGWAGKAVMDQAQRTADAYLFNYPLVLMDMTQRYQVEHMQRPKNQFFHFRVFPDEQFREVVSPNADTLYSLGNLDLSREPMVLSVPETRGHYYMAPILDAWTNVFASPGSRTVGEGGKTFLIAGPNWRGEVPEGLELLRSPTNMAWMINRIKSSGPKDYAQIHVLQDQFTLQSLSRWQGKPSPQVAGSRPLIGVPEINSFAPDQQLARWSSQAFFSIACQLQKDNPARAADAAALENMAAAGLLTENCTADQSLLQQLGTWLGYRAVVAELGNVKQLLEKLPTHNGWRISYDIGEYGQDYRKRALTAKIGLGANTNEDAIYAAARWDDSGQSLSGSERYVLHFDKDQLPPVKGFWSMSLYDPEQFFVANTLNRFAIGDRDDLHFNADGSLDLYIQHQAPAAAAQAANWLPAPAGEFNLMLRLYWPEQEVLNRSWIPPVIQKLR